jgi:hypothetical protein
LALDPPDLVVLLRRPIARAVHVNDRPPSAHGGKASLSGR